MTLAIGPVRVMGAGMVAMEYVTGVCTLVFSI